MRIWKNRQQAAIGFSCIAIVALGIGFWFLFEAMTLEGLQLGGCLLLIAGYFACGGLSAGIAYVFSELPKLRRFIEEGAE